MSKPIDYKGTGLVLLKFKFNKRILDMEESEKQLNKYFCDLAKKLASDYEGSGCVDWGIEVTLVKPSKDLVE